MAVTKSTTVTHNNTSVSAGGADNTSSAVDLTAVDVATISIKITNGATGPTVAGQCQVQTSPDNSNWYNMGGPLQGGVANSGVYSWSNIRITEGVAYARAVVGSNTGQAVTFRTEITTYLKT